MKNLKFVFVLFALLSFLVSTAQSKKEKKAIQAEAIKTAVDARRFIFQAQTASPTGSGIKQLSTGYYFTVLPDSIISNLPYFGRAHQASMASQDVGMKFTSLKFNYTVKNTKKGGWDIKIQTDDVKGAPQVFLTISTSGTTSVRISSNDRQSISYNGYIEGIKKK
ncbi:MAG TPA: DUF4251 domain-containing protein [Cyclobacteriaceae bacterium]